MKKRLIAFVPAALAAGVVLLSACGHAAQEGAPDKPGHVTPANTEKAAKTDGVVADGGGETVESVECGTVEIDSIEQMLIADGTSEGRIGCTEAFNVIDRYLNAEEVPEGWLCDGSGPHSVECENNWGFTFHTEEGAPVESVDCGSITIHSVEQTLVADGTPDGRVGCTEAYNVIGQYLDAEGVPDGWDCAGTDHGYQAVICENTDGLSFHTEER